MAERDGRGAVRVASRARRIGRMDRRAQGCVERIFFLPHVGNVCAPRRATERAPLRICRALFRARTHGQADARDASVCVAAARLLAARTASRAGATAASRGGKNSALRVVGRFVSCHVHRAKILRRRDAARIRADLRAARQRGNFVRALSRHFAVARATHRALSR